MHDADFYTLGLLDLGAMLGNTDLTQSTGLPAPPVIARLAGLSAQAIESLTSPSCLALLQARELLQAELEESRRSMAEAIGHALLGFNVEHRRFLLAIKRSCFNRREIGIHREKTLWNVLIRLSPNLAERMAALEDQLRANDLALTALYKRERTRERRHVLDLIEDHRFLRGVALGSPGLVQKIRAHAPSLTASDPLKHPAKWEQSLLRFVTRAAAKLSANSTLTTYALGSIQASPSSQALHFVHSPQRELSLVRADRPETEKLENLLLRHPAVRARAFVASNNKCEELEAGRHRFLRGGHWTLDPGAKDLRFVAPSRITLNLSNSLLGVAQKALRSGELRYDRLLAILRDALQGIPIADTPSTCPESALDQFLDLGLLVLMPPWRPYDAWLEQQICEFLRAVPNAPALLSIADILDELLAAERRFASTPRPETAIASMEDTFSRLLNTVAHQVGHEGSLTTRPHFFEDVLVEPVAPSADNRILIQVAASTVQKILESATLVSRFAGLFNHRHDVLHTLAAWWKDHEPSRREIPFLVIAQGFAPIWSQFIHFNKTANASTLSMFDPLQTSSLRTLLELRRTLLVNYRALLSASPTKDLISPQDLAELVQSLPCRYAPLVGSCVFVQPIDADGDYWVLNDIHEGTGRYLSRVTPLLEKPLQQRFLDHLTARSTVALEGEEADLLEVMNPWGNLVNAHPPQAAKVLDIPGLRLDLPPARRIRLGDLTVQADLDAEDFRLVDASGRRMLPVNLSTLADVWHPNILRFLLAFGPGQTRGVFPPAHSEGDDNLCSFDRLTCGKLVLRRRRWMIAIQCLREGLQGLSALESYAYVQTWRRRLQLPQVGFYSERTYHGAFKPQYVDLSSPSLCGLFVSSLSRMTAGHLVLEEALPSPASYPFDVMANRRGLELLIDSLAIRAAGGAHSAKA